MRRSPHEAVVMRELGGEGLDEEMYVLVDNATRLIKSEVGTGMLCIFCTEQEASAYLKRVHNEDKDTIEIVKRYPVWNKGSD